MRTGWSSLFFAAQVFAAISFVAMTILTLLDIGLRPFDVQFFLASELCGILMAWTIFFALAMVCKTREHLRVDVVLSVVGPRIRSLLNIASDVLMILYIAALAYLMAELAYGTWLDDIRSQGILRLPQAFAQFGLLLGLVLMFCAQVAITLTDTRHSSDR